MTRSAQIAEAIRKTTPRGTDYAVSRALGISQSNLKRVLEGKRNLGTESCVRAAELLRLPVTEVLAEVGVESAKTPEKKAFWEKRLPRILPTLVAWGAGVGALTTHEVLRAIHYA
jgi:transcriptional regulator with XRE-family HTH domain